jgi:hypothetical protein
MYCGMRNLMKLTAKLGRRYDHELLQTNLTMSGSYIVYIYFMETLKWI